MPEVTRELDPGTYRTEEFEPTFSFRVGEGWTHLPSEKPDYLALARGQTGLRFFKARDIYKPNEGLVEAPDDLAGWVRRHPYLRTSAPETVTVEGSRARGATSSSGTFRRAAASARAAQTAWTSSVLEDVGAIRCLLASAARPTSSTSTRPRRRR